MIHRDIKGANILTNKEGQVKLADFGVATKLHEGESHLVVQGPLDADPAAPAPAPGGPSPAGTPYWMAPEVIQLSRASTASDIWSVGCTIVELVTGEPPYYGLNPHAAMYKIVQDEGPPIPDNISDGLADLLQRCFQKDPEKRATAKQLVKHPWLVSVRKDIRSSWPKSLGGPRSEALKFEGVASVVERMLEAQANLGAHSGSPSQPPSPEASLRGGQGGQQGQQGQGRSQRQQLLLDGHFSSVGGYFYQVGFGDGMAGDQKPPPLPPRRSGTRAGAAAPGGNDGQPVAAAAAEQAGVSGRRTSADGGFETPFRGKMVGGEAAGIASWMMARLPRLANPRFLCFAPRSSQRPRETHANQPPPRLPLAPVRAVRPGPPGPPPGRLRGALHDPRGRHRPPRGGAGLRGHPSGPPGAPDRDAEARGPAGGPGGRPAAVRADGVRRVPPPAGAVRGCAGGGGADCRVPGRRRGGRPHPGHDAAGAKQTRNSLTHPPAAPSGLFAFPALDRRGRGAEPPPPPRVRFFCLREKQVQQSAILLMCTAARGRSDVWEYFCVLGAPSPPFSHIPSPPACARI